MSTRSFRKKEIRRSLLGLLDGADFVAADIGARGDIPPAWLALDGIAIVLSFEPDPEACGRLEATYASRGHESFYRVIPIALGASDGQRTLHVTASGGGTSLFPVDTPMIRAYTNDEYLFPLETREVKTRNARDVFVELRHQRVDLMKLDIQGAELEVLQALSDNILDSVLALEFEVAVQDKAPGYPQFSEVDCFVRSLGFELFDAEPVRVHRTLKGSRANYLEGMLGVHATSPSVAGRIWEWDVLYLRSAESLVRDGDETDLRRLVVCHCVYGLYTEALHAVTLATERGVLEVRNARLMSDFVQGFHRAADYRWWHGLGVTARLLRTLARSLGLRRGRVPGAFTVSARDLPRRTR
jgi:FkbM family methyltransferase